MIDESRLGQLFGSTVVDSSGQKIGTAEHIYTDDATGRPEWVTVKTGLFGMRESFVPLEQANWQGDQIVVPFDKDMIKGAPNIDAESHLSESEEDELYRYYGLDYGSYGSDYSDRESDYGTGMETGTGVRTGRETGTGTFRDEPDRDTDDAMTLSEERLNVRKERVATGRARLRKYVVTENVQKTIPVTREKVVLEREPITDANRDEALSGPEISEGEYEVTLHEERPIVDKEAVPLERVRLSTQEETDEETVSDTVRKEQVEESFDSHDLKR